MTQSIEDKLVIRNIQEDLDDLVLSIQSAYKQLDYPEPTEYDVRQLIATVNEQSIQDGKMIDGIQL